MLNGAGERRQSSVRSAAALMAAVVAAAIVLGSCSDASSPSAASLKDQVFPDPGSKASQALDLQQIAAAQQAIADCMKAKGFTYVKDDPQKQVYAGSAWYAGDNPKAWAATYGYGISIPIDDAQAAAHQLPNDIYVATLPAATQGAWRLAFEGTDAAPGCRVAGDALPSSTRDQEIVEKTFAAQLDDMRQRIFVDTRITSGESSWRACMTTAGFNQFTHPDDATKSIQKRLDQLHAAADDTTVDVQLAALQHDERAMATADAGCPFSNFGGWQTAYDEVYREYEAAFLKDHFDDIQRAIGSG